MDQIDFHTEHRLSDSVALQFFVLRHHLLRRALVLAVAMLGGLVLTTLLNGAPLRDSLEDLQYNAGRYVMLFLVGLALVQLTILLLAYRAWARRPKPREIRATVTAQGLALQKDGFSYTAKWSDADLVTQSRSAYLMKFNQLYMRLPKRGFTPQTDTLFRALARNAPAGANRLGS